MSYRLKGQKVIINGVEQYIIPSALPNSPTNGCFAIDITDNKFKSYSQTKGRWVILGDAEDFVFDNSTNGFSSDNIQDAIEEAKDTAEGIARYCVTCGFDGTASSGRYLEFSSNVDSNIAGFIVPRSSYLKEISFAIQSNRACTFTYYKWSGTTETSLGTINTTSSQRKKSVIDLNISLNANEELRVKCTSGSGARPVFCLFLVYQ